MIDKQLQMARGAQAEALLKNEMLQGALKELEEKYMGTWRATIGSERDAREYLWLSWHVLDDFRNLLALAVRNGKVSQQDIERMAGMNRAA